MEVQTVAHFLSMYHCKARGHVLEELCYPQRLFVHRSGPLWVSQPGSVVVHRGIQPRTSSVKQHGISSLIYKHVRCTPGFSVAAPAKLETDLTRRLAFLVSVYLSNWRGDMTGQI